MTAAAWILAIAYVALCAAVWGVVGHGAAKGCPWCRGMLLMPPKGGE